MNDGILYWNTDPEMFRINGSVPVGYYGLLFAIGILLAFAIVKRIYTKEKVPLKDLDNLLIYVVIGIMLGARLGHCLFYEFDYFIKHPLEIFLPITKVDGEYQFGGYRGLASHGGGIGVLIAVILYSRKYKVPVLWLLDRMAIAIPVTAAFIRFGNFMNSEIYGKPTNGNWGVIFVRDDLVPRHPTQLYEAFSYLLIFVALYLLYRSKAVAKYNGVIFGYFLILLFSARIIIEFFKENQEAFEDGMALNMGQLLSIPFIIAGIVLVIKKQPARLPVVFNDTLPKPEDRL